MATKESTPKPKLTWVEQFQLNYEGLSKEAKDLEQYLKRNYKGNPYLPWATMLKSLYIQDPNAIINKQASGTLLLTNAYQVQFNTPNQHNIVQSSVSPMVHVSVTFLGNTVDDYYPIQDSVYAAVQLVDQNLVNKALQRAVARCISMATGLGLKLYEGQDLQFEEEKKPITRNTTPVTKAPTVETVPVTSKPKTEAMDDRVLEPTTIEPGVSEPSVILLDNPHILELIDLIYNGDKAIIESTLKDVNGRFVERYGIALSPTMAKTALYEALAMTPTPENLLKMFKTRLGVN